MIFRLPYLLSFIICWGIVISGCQSIINSEGLANKRDSLAKLFAGDCHGLYSTSENADTVIRLSSSEENTIFSIDGKAAGQAKYLKACIEKRKNMRLLLLRWNARQRKNQRNHPTVVRFMISVL